MRRILIAGIGNIFLGDDGFGSEVAQRLLTLDYPEGVQVVDIGIRGMDLAYTLLDGYDTLLLVDTVARGGPPGTLYLIEPDVPDGGDQTAAEAGDAAGRRAVETHSMDPVKVLAYAAALGAHLPHTLLVGCEPGPLDGEDDLSMGLSAAVRLAVDGAIRMVNDLVHELLTAEEGSVASVAESTQRAPGAVKGASTCREKSSSSAASS